MEKDYIITLVERLLFQRCIIIGLYYFSLKQVNNIKSMTAVRGSFIFFVYNDSHPSLNQQ